MSHLQTITAERNVEMTNDCVHINLQEYYKGQVRILDGSIQPFQNGDVNNLRGQLKNFPYIARTINNLSHC